MRLPTTLVARIVQRRSFFSQMLFQQCHTKSSVTKVKTSIQSDEASVSNLTLEDIDVAECFKDTFSLNILVCGRTGVGKSSLINNLVGKEVCKVNDPGLEGGNLNRGTTEISEIKANTDNVSVTIYDSPGLRCGLEDGTVDERYLHDMYDKCKDVDLVLYCMEMTASHYTAAEIRATRLFTRRFQPEFWNRCVLVMTKANMVRIPPSQKGNEREYHQRLYDNITKHFCKELVEQGVSTAIANELPGVAAGIIQPEDDEERYIWYPSDKVKPSERPVDFLSELWLTCFDKTARESQAKLLRATTRQRVKPLPVASETDETIKKQLEESKKQVEELTRKHSQPLTPGAIAEGIVTGVVGCYLALFACIMLIALGECLFDRLSSKYQAIKTMLK